jgi:hypothetical protein
MISFIFIFMGLASAHAQLIELHAHQGNWEEKAKNAVTENFLQTIVQNTFDVPFEAYSVEIKGRKKIIRPMKFNTKTKAWDQVGFRLSFDHTRFLMRMIAAPYPTTITAEDDQVTFENGLISPEYEASEDPISNVKTAVVGFDILFDHVVVDRTTLAVKNITYRYGSVNHFIVYWNNNKIISQEVNFYPNGYELVNATLYGNASTALNGLFNNLHGKLYYYGMPGFYAKGSARFQEKDFIFRPTEVALRLQNRSSLFSSAVATKKEDKIIPLHSQTIPVLDAPLTGKNDQLTFQITRGIRVCDAYKKNIIFVEWKNCIDYPAFTPIDTKRFQLGSFTAGHMIFKEWLEK